MFACRHWQDLHGTLSEFNEMIHLIRESEVLLLSPKALQWQQIDLQPVSLPY